LSAKDDVRLSVGAELFFILRARIGLITDNDGIIFVNNHGNSCSSVIVREFFLLIDEDGEGV